ncbi:MAG: glycosyltransferase family 4 protein [Micrococcus sp.]|nr:glycosyltransferase family 4 protein [Micrococcus sp.]
MRRVRLIANQGSVGGGEVMLHLRARALRELECPVVISAPAEPGELAARLEADGFAVERVEGKGRADYMHALRRTVKSRGHELLWCEGLLPAVALTGRAHRVVHLHQEPQGRVQSLLARWARRGTEAVLVSSTFMARQVPGARVVQNWTQDFPRPESHRPGPVSVPPTVGFLGRLSEDKGVLTYLEAAHKLATGPSPVAAFVMAGETRFVDAAEAERIDNAVQRSSAYVTSLGWQETSTFLDSIDILVVPSVWEEPFGLVAAEAMAAGVTLVVSDAGALPEVAGPGYPYVFPRGDAAALAAVLRRALADDRTPLIAAQRRRWESEYSPAAGREAMRGLMEELTTGRPA